MTDEPRDRLPGSEPEPGAEPESADRPAPGGREQDQAGGGQPYGRRPTGKRPYGARPGGPARGGQPYGQRPPGGRPYGDRPPGPRPSGGKPGGRPYGDRPPGRLDERSRGPWQRGPGPRGARSDWDRRDPPPAQRSSSGPVSAELLGEGEEIVAGRRPVEEAFAARREARRLLVVPGRRAALDQLVLHATMLRIPVVEVEGGTLTAVSGFDGHQGIALVVASRRWATLDEVLALAKARNEPPFVLALDHLEDPQNVGTLLRSAEACGVHGVIFPTRGAAPISPAAIKTSAGAIEHLLLVPLPDLASALVDLHTRGVRVIGADGDASLTVREVDLRGPVVIVTGSEGRGLNAKVRKRVDVMARIPMRGKVASLNASVAGSVFLFEAAAQRDLPEAERPPGKPVLDTQTVGARVEGESPAALRGPRSDAPQALTATDLEASAEPDTSPSSEPVADDLLPEAPAGPPADEPA